MTARFRDDHPEDKVSPVIAAIARLKHPPLRLQLETDAVVSAETADKSRMASDQIWRHLSLSTDFAPQCNGDEHV